MVFSSTVFVFIFLPIVLGIYYISKDHCRNYILLIASLIFYAYGEPAFVFVMVLSIIFNWAAALIVAKLKNNNRDALPLLVLAIVCNVSILFIYKYLDFAISICGLFLRKNLAIYGITLPIGISFFTFQSISYLVDVYRGNGEVQINPLNVGLYISFFPQLIAGPIVRYQTIADQIKNRIANTELIESGTKRFICGFCKKIILANNLATIADAMFGWENLTTIPVGYAWIGSICFSLQIYFDFSGYSDMAIGLGRMFGFKFQENFNYPYVSKSITEFWRRWHISLSQWFRDYIYIPLGGSRVGIVRNILNLFVVWFLTGLWHGAGFTFIIWGFSYFVMLVIEKFIIKPEKRSGIIFKLLWQVMTILVVNFNWVIFNSSGLSRAIQYLLAMLGSIYHNPLWNNSKLLLFSDNLIYIILGIILSTPIIPFLSKFFVNIENKWMGIAVDILYLIGFIWAVSFLIIGMHNPFIYFNF